MQQPPCDDDCRRLLFAAEDGAAITLEDLIAAGLDGEYRHRIPDLRIVMRDGPSRCRLLAAIVLVSWADETGFRQITDWATRPQSVPGHDDPTEFDRFSGADASFEMMAEAVFDSFWNDSRPDLQHHQAVTLEALLGVVPQHYVGQSLGRALQRDRSVLSRVASDLRAAVERSVSAAEIASAPFDLPFQTAALLAPLAVVDDGRAASAAARLRSVPGISDRAVRELADSLSIGSGPRTYRELRALHESASAGVRDAVDVAWHRRLRNAPDVGDAHDGRY